ncbi:MAG TPA: NAD(P)-dependent alcohol dehydrogenase [Nitrospirota bacterium]|nr:NAD(P)-dependent alcohol dehydrogenase [Nitrospirota bacterium]
MKAVTINKYGGNNVIEIRELSRPRPSLSEVLIRVRAAGVNPVDWKIRDGMLRSMLGQSFPIVLGRECAGEVVETGTAAKLFKEGDQVIAITHMLKPGSFAEYAVAPEQTVYPKPANISFEEAASIPIAGLTALRSLRDAGEISAGKMVLVVGAAGGVGHFAVQIAKVFGATVTGVCKGENAAFVKGLGADEVIDYTREDFTRGKERYDIIFDAVAKRTFEECKDVLTPNGIYIRTLPNAGLTEEAGKKAKGVPGGPTPEDMDWMKDQIEADRIRIAIDRVYSLDEAREALAYSEAERARGKIVLKAA